MDRPVEIRCRIFETGRSEGCSCVCEKLRCPKLRFVLSGAELLSGTSVRIGMLCLPCSESLHEAVPASLRPVPSCFGLHFCRANRGAECGLFVFTKSMLPAYGKTGPSWCVCLRKPYFAAERNGSSPGNGKGRSSPIIYSVWSGDRSVYERSGRCRRCAAGFGDDSPWHFVMATGNEKSGSFLCCRSFRCRSVRFYRNLSLRGYSSAGEEMRRTRPEFLWSVSLKSCC